MDTGVRAKLIIIGLFLASIALGYYIFTQFTHRSRVSTNQQTNTLQPIKQITPIPTVTPTPSPTQAVVDPNTIGQNTTDTKGGLPKTGFPLPLAGAFGASAAISGYFLRKYPK